MNIQDGKLDKIGIFYDGNYFAYVSNYYCYHHEQQKRLSIKGLHEYVRHKVAEHEDRNVKHCQIVDAHYFRGRLSAMDARQRNALFNERVFDHVLMNEGVVTHYLPLGPQGEKGIDVWFALEVYELAVYKQFNVVVLVASDGGFVPLARKLNALGIRVMVLGWDFTVEVEGLTKETVTSQRLLSEVSYPIMMHENIEKGLNEGDELIESLFVASREDTRRNHDEHYSDEDGAEYTPSEDAEIMTGHIKAIKNGFGFISPDDGSDDLYFYWADLTNCDFNDIQDNDPVTFEKSVNQRGPCAKNIEVLD